MQFRANTVDAILILCGFSILTDLAFGAVNQFRIKSEKKWIFFENPVPILYPDDYETISRHIENDQNNLFAKNEGATRWFVDFFLPFGIHIRLAMVIIASALRIYRNGRQVA